MKRDTMEPTERQNVVVVSVRLSKNDAALCQERAARLGVGISTYVRMLIRQHLANEGAYNHPLVDGARREAAATREPEMTRRQQRQA